MKKSVRGKIWKEEEFQDHKTSELMRNLEIPDLVARVLSSRVSTIEDGYHFITPRIKNMMPDPFHLIDMEKGVMRTIQAIKAAEKICIFADYDVDGATSSSLIKNILKEIKVDSDIYVPDRIEEGYGPSRLAMDRIKEAGTRLVITVDCGAMAHEALKYAKEIGLDVIVIDHHITAEIMPDAVAVINPNRLDESSEYGYLAAVGVSFLFAAALISKLNDAGFFTANISKPNLMQYLDLVALGTVCDVMPLTGLNRAFVQQGLKVMMKRQNKGLKKLLDIAEVKEKPNAYHLGYIIGPRINAGGRVGRSNMGATLLSSSSEEQTTSLSEALNQSNNDRRAIELFMLKEALEIAEPQKNSPMIFVAKKDWHQGVIGIVAGRLKEQYEKPVAVIAIDENGIGKASCRSVKGVNFGTKLIEAKNQGLIINGGGHAMAAGFTAEEKSLDKLQDFLCEMIEKELANLPETKILYYHAELTSSAVNIDLIEQLNILEPYGHGNPEPIFRISNLYVLKADIVGEKHIRCLLAPDKNAFGTKPVTAICFNSVGTPIQQILLNPKPLKIDAIGALKMNIWQDKKTVQLQIKDLICQE